MEVEPIPRSALELVQAEFFLQLPMGLLTNPGSVPCGGVRAPTFGEVRTSSGDRWQPEVFNIANACRGFYDYLLVGCGPLFSPGICWIGSKMNLSGSIVQRLQMNS